MWRASGKPSARPRMAHTIAERERSLGATGFTPVCNSPSIPEASAEASPQWTTCPTFSLSPPASKTSKPPARGEMVCTATPRRTVTPFATASFSIASASACMPPSTSHTPSCSTWAISISVAGAEKGEEPT